AKATGSQLLSGDLFDHVADELAHLRHAVPLRQDGRTVAANRIDIDVRHTVIVAVVPEVVGVPGGSGVACVGVPPPEAEADAAAHGAPMLRHDARDLDHGGVGRAVIHGAVVPRIDVP